MRLLLVALLACVVPAAVARDDVPTQLWLYYPTNLLVDTNIDRLERIWSRAARAGYTHVLLADSKFSRLAEMDGRYFRNIERVKRIAAAHKLTLVPAVFQIGYSNDLLSMDPNLAEGLPVKDAPFVVRGGEARLESDPATKLDRIAFKDGAVTLDGGHAVFKPAEGNVRLCYSVRVTPFRCYHVCVKVKTDALIGAKPEVKVLAGERSLQWQNLPVKPTQDWTEHHVVFNSLEHDKVNLYLGVWGGTKGVLEWRDWAIEEVGLLNVLRRPGAPLVVKDEATGKVLAEGVDFERVADPRMGNQPWPGEYEAWHEPPPLRTTKLPDGTRLRVSWYHPAVIHDGQVSCCPSESKTLDLLADQAKRMHAAWGAGAYMMSHDEVRTLNWDAACQARKLSPGQILADNVKRCTELVKPRRAYVWSDMFDPHHNAVRGPYYLVNGDLTGAWEGLDKDVVIMNWNEGEREKSLHFFAGRGHKQVIATYYDDASRASTKRWLATAKDDASVEGFMYTSWRNDYERLEAFARTVRRD